MGHVDYSVRGRVAVLAFQSPPVNSLSLPLRCDLVAALDRVMADPAVDAAVLIGANGTFCAGADIREFGTPEMLRGPTIWSVNSLLDDASKPVVAAIEGVALGGGLELALSCHYRVALESARVGLPEVKLGLVPGAGGTQRLPRLIGVEGALNVMLGGEPVPAPLFAGSPLFDRLVKTDLLPAALEVAEAAAAARASGKPLPRVRDRRVVEPDLEALLQFARNTARTAFKEYPAPLAIIDAVQAAAKLPFDAGHAEESRLFRPLLDSPVSLALRHVFFAERAASRDNGLPAGTAVRNIGSVAIIGAGTMGTGIAINFLNAGIPVHLLELGQEALERGVARVRDVYESQVRKGKLDAAKSAARMALLSRDASDKIRRATLRRAPAAIAELTPGTRVYFWSPHPMKGRQKQDALRWRGPATVIARESVGRYYVGWRSRVFMVAKDQLRLATTEEAAAHEVNGKDMAMTADPKCYQDMTGAPPPARRQPAAAAPVLPPLQNLPSANRALQDVLNAEQEKETGQDRLLKDVAQQDPKEVAVAQVPLALPEPLQATLAVMNEAPDDGRLSAQKRGILLDDNYAPVDEEKQSGGCAISIPGNLHDPG